LKYFDTEFAEQPKYFVSSKLLSSM